MRETHITLPELALIAITRAALGAGLGLLLYSQAQTPSGQPAPQPGPIDPPAIKPRDGGKMPEAAPS